MVRPAHLVRCVSLLLLAVVGVHEARFRLTAADDSGEALSALGHGAGGLGSLLALAAAVAFGVLVVRALAAPGGEGPRRISWRRAWAGATLAIVAIFLVQELAEGVLGGGVADAGAAEGLWVAVLLSVPAGLIVAFGLRVVSWAEDGRAGPALALAITWSPGPTPIVRRSKAAPARAGARSPLVPRGPPFAAA